MKDDNGYDSGPFIAAEAQVDDLRERVGELEAEITKIHTLWVADLRDLNGRVRELEQGIRAWIDAQQIDQASIYDLCALLREVKS